jgi:preprotein translocase SecE subunit
MYKREEGMWARVPVAVVGGIVTVAATRTAMTWSFWPGRYIWGGIAFAVCACATLWLAFFHRKTGDVLIDTESEMRKVVWPTREEVQGSTIVVIATTLILGVGVFVCDVVVARVLSWVRLYKL